MSTHGPSETVYLCAHAELPNFHKCKINTGTCIWQRATLMSRVQVSHF